MAFPNPNATTFVEIFKYSNNITNGVFGYGILIAVFFVIYARLSYAENSKAFAVATWVTGITAVLLRLMDVINDFAMYIAIILVIIGVVSLKSSDKE